MTNEVENASKAPASGDTSGRQPETETPLAEPVIHGRESKPEATDDTKSGPVEIGGRKGPEPTRYGDWEKNGRCIDF